MSHETRKVFTPTTPATKTFVTRDIKINRHLRSGLKTPGKQIVLYGHSGCGKSTLIANELSKIYEYFVTTRCMDGMTFESIILDAFDQLSKFYPETVVKKKGFSISPEISLEYNQIRGSIKLFEVSKHKEVTHKSFVPPQLTPQRLGKFFGESKCCWILEDFHKIRDKEKTRTSQIMKVFMDMAAEYPELKLIALGAVGTARQVIEYDREMNNRVSEILIPYMKDIEIESIIETGESLLNVKFKEKVKKQIIKYSCGLPSICHQICLNICFNRHVEKTQPKRVDFDIDDFDEAIENYLEDKSDTYKSEFDRAIKIPNHSKQNGPKELLKAALRVNKDEFSFDEIYSSIKSKGIDKKNAESITNDLCSVDRSEILVFDENSNKYRFNNLFLKSYAVYRLTEKDDDEPRPKSSHDQKIVNRLLEIIEKDLSNEFEIFIEEL